jgi:hypothetical protein
MTGNSRNVERMDSFLVIARFHTEAPVSAPVSDYVQAWLRASRIWSRIWRSNSIEEEQLEFYAEFSSEPRVETEASGLAVVLDGRPEATRWKDFGVLMVDDISKAFPEVRFVGFES